MLPLLLLPAGLLIEYSGLGQLLIGPVFDASTGKWPYYKSHWLTSDILHTGGKNFLVIAAGSFLIFVLSFIVKRFKPFRKGAADLPAASLAGPALVPMICFPWYSAGMQPYSISYFF